MSSGLVPSRRTTTSSRTPGKVNTGTVWFQRTGLRSCGECRTAARQIFLTALEGK